MKQVFLTIDDSPSTVTKEKVDFLAKKGIPALFFCIGEQIEAHPESVTYAIAHGFAIGNHSYSHPYFSDLSLKQIEQEIKQTEQLINDIYHQAGKVRTARYFRFPYGDKGDGLKGRYTHFWRKSNKRRKEDIQLLLKRFGFQKPLLRNTYGFYKRFGLDGDLDWHWTFDSLDYLVHPDNDHKAKEIVNRLTALQPKNPLVKNIKEHYWLANAKTDEILLMHDHLASHQAFFEMMEVLSDLPIVFQEIP